MASKIAGLTIPDRPLNDFEEHVYKIAQRLEKKDPEQEVCTTAHSTIPLPSNNELIQEAGLGHRHRGSRPKIPLGLAGTRRNRIPAHRRAEAL
jgi:hypothetical protein